MELVFRTVDPKGLSILLGEAREVHFSFGGNVLACRMAGEMMISAEFSPLNSAPPLPERVVLAGAFSDFALSVYRALIEVKPGETITYSALAARIGRPEAVRAVASAVARNPFALIIPCHRVIPRHNPPGRYRWGTPLKATLLIQESSHPSESQLF